MRGQKRNRDLHIVVPDVDVHLVLLARDQELEPVGVVLHLDARLQQLRGALQQVLMLVCHALELLEPYEQEEGFKTRAVIEVRAHSISYLAPDKKKKAHTKQFLTYIKLVLQGAFQ